MKEEKGFKKPSVGHPYHELHKIPYLGSYFLQFNTFVVGLYGYFNIWFLDTMCLISHMKQGVEITLSIEDKCESVKAIFLFNIMI